MKRATSSSMPPYRASFYFNPRPHEEGDKLVGDLDYDIEHFNPRPHEEGDVIKFSSIFFIILFQSTPS